MTSTSPRKTDSMQKHIQNIQNPKTKKAFLIFLSVFICVIFLYAAFQSNARQHPAETEIPTGTENGALDNKDPEFDLSALPPEEEVREEILTGKIKSGETLTSLLGPWLSPKEILELNQATKPVFDLRKIRMGQEYKITLINDAFVRFEYAASKTHYLEVDREENVFTAIYQPFAYEVTPTTLRGTIQTNLCDAIGAENLGLAVRLANIFGWEIDFTRDLREGDSFSVHVEKRYYEGKFQGYGNILAAEFMIRGKRFDAYRFQNTDGSFDFYSSSGKNLGHFFLKTPVAFTRISSGFSLSRFHPISKAYKPHYGVDYAAPVGTPIYALGSGTLTQVTENKASGKFIRINHSNGYETAYLHMSRFARGMRAGKKITQGELIGYVGQTGYATGPHLCFRMKKNGSPVDPTRIEKPRAKELPKAQRENFMAIVESLKPKLAQEYQFAQSVSPQAETGEKVN